MCAAVVIIAIDLKTYYTFMNKLNYDLNYGNLAFNVLFLN